MSLVYLILIFLSPKLLASVLLFKLDYPLLGTVAGLWWLWDALD